jgi:peptide/nickel transport system permease protein
LSDPRRRSWLAEARSRFFANRLAVFGLVLIGIFLIGAISHPILMATVWERDVYHPIYGHDSTETELTVVQAVTDPDTEIDVMNARLYDPFAQPGDVVVRVTLPEPFTPEHPLGVDNLGRDVLSMVLAAAAPSFVVGLSAAITTAIVGVIVATIGAYFRRGTDAVLTQVSDALLVLPAPLLMVILGAGPLRDYITPLVFGILYGVVSGAGAAAIVLRSQALTILARPFIDAARVAGAGWKEIILHHLLPHLVPVAALYMLLGVSGAIVADGFVSFLGFSDTRLNWGTIIFFALSLPPSNSTGIPWEALGSAAAAITLFSAAFYLVGLGVRDIARPRNS